MPTRISQLSTDGVGGIPIDEVPNRLLSYTVLVNSDHDRRRVELLMKLAVIHAKNETGDGSGFCNHPDSVIKLHVNSEDEKHLFRKQYPIPQALLPALNKVLERWRDAGKIKLAPPGTKFNSPLLVVPKKDENGKMTKVRVCIDIRQLNLYLIENDRFQLPFIPDVLAAFAGGKLFGEYDLSEAYYQFRVQVESQKYTAFTWMDQQWICVGCPFGIKHIPSLFQRFMVNLFADMPFVFPYIDNIGFASDTWEQHYEHANAIMERLNSVNLRVNPSSYNLGNTHMRVLGHVLSEKGIALDPEKTEMIQAWPLPTDGSQMASALGLGAFLRDHIRHYADITAPLEALKKEKTIVWTDRLKQHWMLFKRAFANAPLLAFPDWTKRFVIAHDASQTGVGGVLYQPSDDTNAITPDNIVAICSKQLNETQRNYPVYKKELFGLIYCLRKFHTFVHGRTGVIALTDHKPLVHIMSQRVMTVALQQWVDVLMDYDLTIHYRPGLLHIIPDALSRMYAATYSNPKLVWGTMDNITIMNNFNNVSSPSDFLCQQSLDAIQPMSAVSKRHKVNDTYNIYNVVKESQGGNKVKIKTKIKTKHNHNETDMELEEEPSASIQRAHISIHAEVLPDELCGEFDSARLTAPLYEACNAFNARTARIAIRSHAHIRSATTSSSSSSDAQAPVSHTLSDEEKLLLAYEKRGMMRPDDSTRKRLLEKAHAAHFGEKHMQYFIQREGYWWPRMRQDIADVVGKCNACRHHNIEVSGFHPSHPIHACQPGDHYQIDLAAFQRSVNGYTCCLVLVDVFTGFIVLRALRDKTMETIANELWSIFSIIGIPRILQSDNGSEFKNQVIATLNKMIGIPHRFISEYNPRADGKVERCVKTVKQTVMKLLNGATVYWPYHLPFVQYSYNDKIQSLTGSTAFSLMYGRRPNNAVDYNIDPDTALPADIGAWMKYRDDLVSLVFPAISKRAARHQDKYRQRLDKSRRRLIRDFMQVGTLVMIKDPKYLNQNKHVRPSHEPTYIGPYTIVKANRHGTYTVKDGLGNALNRNVPLDQMKVVPTADDERSTSAANNDDASLSGEHEVDTILSHRETEEGQLEYHVRWVGMPKLSQTTWENESNFVDTSVIEKYFREKSLQSKDQRQARARSLGVNTNNTYCFAFSGFAFPNRTGRVLTHP